MTIITMQTADDSDYIYIDIRDIDIFTIYVHVHINSLHFNENY